MVPTFLAGQVHAYEALAAQQSTESAPAARPSIAPSSLRATSREAIQLVWYAPAELALARRSPAFADLLDELHDAPLDEDLDDLDLAEDAAEVEDRREALEILARGPAVPGDHLPSMLASEVRADGRLVPPVALLAGELEIQLDALEELKATLSTAGPSAGIDPEAREVLAVASAYLASPGLPGSPSVAEGLTARIRDTFDRKNLLTERHLRTQSERALLEGRHARWLLVMGGRHVRALLRAGGEPVPTYLPEALARRLPSSVRVRARVLARVHPGIEAHEPARAALRPIALGLVTKR